MAHSEEFRTFEDVRARLDQIVDEVNAEGISLDEALVLYEEAVKLGLSACDLSEHDIDAALGMAEGAEAAPADGAPAEAASADAPAPAETTDSTPAFQG